MRNSRGDLGGSKEDDDPAVKRTYGGRDRWSSSPKWNAECEA